MIGLLHLVWAPLGPAPLREFLRSYHAHGAGIEHELVIVLNGLQAAGPDAARTREALLAELHGTPHRLISLEEPVLDLAAYGRSAQLTDHEYLCCLNSYSDIRGEQWLAHLDEALRAPGVGLVGATASWESQAEWIRGKIRYWPYQLATLRTALREFPRFPNPHIRTTAFMLERRLMLGLGLERAADKRAAYLLESGPASITRQVQEQGLRTLVVGRDGQAFDVEDWPRSHTFRAGRQENLLVADNRTRDWELASPRLRRRLSRDSWGEAAS